MKIEKVFIATPTAGGIVTTAYANSLMGITLVLVHKNIRYRYLNFDGSDIVMARNYLANSFILDKAYSHILFVDSDMAVTQDAFVMMLDSGKEFVGAIYPERKLDLEKYGDYVREGRTHQAALALSLKYNVKHFSNDVKAAHGLCHVRGLGFGCVLIAKSVFERLIAAKGVDKLVSEKLQKAGLRGEAYDFFGEISLQGSDYLSEDYSFCERVNGHAICEISALIGGLVGHVGQFTYGAPYVENLKARSASPPKPQAE